MDSIDDYKKSMTAGKFVIYPFQEKPATNWELNMENEVIFNNNHDPLTKCLSSVNNIS